MVKRMTKTTPQKQWGAFYTPDAVVRSLVRWAVRFESDRMLDPACGDGRFLTVHPNSVGVEQDPKAAQLVHERAPGALIHQGDFFSWASETHERFECAAGNPPFIRYQKFTGKFRESALNFCARQGARFSSLMSSWAPFIVATASLLKTGGRMAFVVPAEIGHAPYAKPVIEYLTGKFNRVHIVAVRKKLFTNLSEDCWLLYAEGFSGKTKDIQLSCLERFEDLPAPPQESRLVSLTEWRSWNCHLRPFLLGDDIRDLYRTVSENLRSRRLGDIAKVGIGYVTGDNDFFHLRPSEAQGREIPERFLLPTVRSGKSLAGEAITPQTVEDWRKKNAPNFLLRIRSNETVPLSVLRYLDSEPGRRARESYKCRNRDPWYVVPDVTVPHAFLSYMSGEAPSLVANCADCSGANSVHMVQLINSESLTDLRILWKMPFSHLSCEIEGHPLGGGMLKLEPREAGRVVLAPEKTFSPFDHRLIREGLETMRRWRHCGE